MRRFAAAISIAVLAAVLSAGSAHAWMKEGLTRGTVVTVGEDRIVVQGQEGGQTSFEVAQVKEGDAFVKDKAQLELIKTFKQGDLVAVSWGQDHTGHSFIVRLRKIMALETEGRVRGTVITAGEQNLVIQKDAGGQMTLEPKWVQVNGQWGRSQEQIAYFHTLKQGDQVEATWKLDEGTHFCVQSIAKLGADGARATAETRPGGGLESHSDQPGARRAEAEVPEWLRDHTVRGTVVAIGEEGRVVIQKAEGGQMTLEPRWVRLPGQREMQRHPEIVNYAKGLKQGDTVDAIWRAGDGGHMMNWGIAKPGQDMVGRLPVEPGGVWTGSKASGAGAEGQRAAAAGEGQRRAEAGDEAEIQALRSEVGALRQEIAALKDLINKAVAAK